MRDRTADLVAALAEILPPDTDAAALADALWLAAASPAPGPAPAPADPAPSGAPDAAGTRAAAPPAPTATGPAPDGAPPTGPADGAAPDGRPSARTGPGPGAGPAPGTATTRALPQALALGRSLRALKRRYPNGPRRTLDLDATTHAYARTGELLPVLRSEPEPWFEALVLTDRAPSMGLWQDTLAEFTTLLAGLGAFRRIRALNLDLDPRPAVTDPLGRPVDHHRLTGRRRLLLVLSDCAGPSWRDPAVWQLLHAWSAGGPVVLLNPLPSRLWNRTGLDLPAVRVRHRRPATRNTELAYVLPPMLAAAFGPDLGWVPLPTVGLTAHALRRWADGLMRAAPAGYDAVLVPASGTLASPFAPAAGAVPAAGAAAAPAAGAAPDPVGRAAAFLHTASPAARRLAVLCSPFDSLSPSLLRLLREEFVPGAGAADLADLLTGGLLDPGDPHALAFHPEARAALLAHLDRHDAWALRSALTQQLAAHGPGGTPTDLDPDGLPPDLVPFARASAGLLALLAPARRRGPVPAPGPVPVSEEGPQVRFPDPERSAALLVGFAEADGRHTSRRLAADLYGLRQVLMSPTGWGLPLTRCRMAFGLPGIGPEELFDGAEAEAPDTLLLYVQGTPFPDDPDRRWAEVLRGILHRRPAATTVVLLSMDGAPRTAQDLQESFPARNTVLVGREPHSPYDGFSIAGAVAAMAERGMPGGPDLLPVGRLFDYDPEHPGTDRELTAGPLTELALLRNRHAPAHLAPAAADTYSRLVQDLERTGADLRPELVAILSALVSFVHEYAPGPEVPERRLLLLADLEQFLGPALEVGAQEGADGTIALTRRPRGPAFRVPFSVQDPAHVPPGRSAFDVPPQTDPVRVLLLFQAVGRASGDRGHVLPGPDGRHSVVLTVPYHPAPPQPVVLSRPAGPGVVVRSAASVFGDAEPLPADLRQRLDDLYQQALLDSELADWAERTRFDRDEVVRWRWTSTAEVMTSYLPALERAVADARGPAGALPGLQLCLYVAEFPLVEDDTQQQQPWAEAADRLARTERYERSLARTPDAGLGVVLSDAVHAALVDRGHGELVLQYAESEHDDGAAGPVHCWYGIPGRSREQVAARLADGHPGDRSPRGGRLFHLAGEVAEELRVLGVRAGTVLFVQTPAGELETTADPDVLLAALLEVLGPGGTLVMSAATPENSYRRAAAEAARAGLGPEEAGELLAAVPAFDRERTPASPSAGVLAERLRRLPGSVRSDHPQHSFVARGPLAARIVSGQELEDPFGPESPVGRLRGAGALVLLLGVPPRHCLAWRPRGLTSPVPDRSFVRYPDGRTAWVEHAVVVPGPDVPELDGVILREAPGLARGVVADTDAVLVHLVAGSLLAERWQGGREP
ncbi:SAV_2336 N-terminal domain-related protein [Kitasatospora phosalacinea]|uniref:Uncharacterized protein n=1 Tax=Kitasatospora phosalacinea TaxID=2065 RepID=A0A9W6UJ78_9ACTN|nr:SAV_2336 N-terminal domain-related protein [Kitasatospora phosalacinea]GLW52106.1 hypothetical protein Kpho01_01170 [Kitasatospora phosalacinea]